MIMFSTNHYYQNNHDYYCYCVVVWWRWCHKECSHTKKREQEPNRIKCRGTCLQFIIIIGILK